jgi:3-hydroxybutyryl-CoA dehydrogenase
VTRIAVLGEGHRAAQIGSEFALGGCSVSWLNVDTERSQRRVEEALRLAVAHGLAAPPELERARTLVAVAEPAAGVDGRLTLILEVLSEGLDGKAQAIVPLAAAHPEALIATSGESVSATAVGEAAGVGERIVGVRYGSPPMLTPLVELVAARDTPPRLLDRVSQLLRAIGKRPVTLRREVPGMLAGRLEAAMLGACLWLLEQGVADAEQIDEVVRDGLARSWGVAGPLQAAALRDPAALAAIGAASSDGAAHVPAEALTQLAGAGIPAALREHLEEQLARALREERERQQARARG